MSKEELIEDILDIINSENSGLSAEQRLQEIEELLKQQEDENKEYQDWIRLREASRDDFGERLCYCGHTYLCECPDPNEQEFQDAVKKGTIRPESPTNGWRKTKRGLHKPKDLNQDKYRF